jgi:signal transduction histidine kinase
MSLTSKILRIFSGLFIFQLLSIALCFFILFIKSKNEIPHNIITSLTEIDIDSIESVALQQKFKNIQSRDLLIYKILQLNNLDSARFIPLSSYSSYTSTNRSYQCQSIKGLYICLDSHNKSAFSFIPLKIESQVIGYLQLEKRIFQNSSNLEKFFATIALTITFVFFVNILLFISIWVRFLKPETKKLELVFEKKTLDPTIQIKDYQSIQSKFIDAINSFQQIQFEKLKLESQVTSINLARQVAHDIRSPLTALDMVMSKSQSLPEDERKIVRHAVRRIHDIANNLLIQNKKSVSPNEETIKPEMLAPIIESIVSEKRTEYNSLIGVNLKASINSNNFHLFSKINPSELKRILSNLINNSIESFPKNTGDISVDFFEKDQFIHISISDNGPGIPSHVIEKLFSQDFQSTKNKGSGIGLKSAKEFLNKIDGDLILDSSSNGTKVTIKLPVVESPSWFLNTLEIKSNSKITIIDDDKSIHALWEQRLKQVSQKSQITHLSNFEMIEAKQDLFLVDFEFQGESFNGLDQIIEMNLEHTVLVTSHYDELEIQTKCLEHKIKIIPKEVAHLIPISEIKENQSVNMILIDDDELIRLSWEMKAQMIGKSIKTFSTFNDFKNLMPQIDRSSEIFIDSELGADLKGEEVAKILFEQGFKSIHLCTGYSPEDFAPMPWIKSIRGKAFPT